MFIQTSRLTIHPFSDEDRDVMISIFKSNIVNRTYMLPDFETDEPAIRLFNRFKELSLDEKRYVGGIYLGERPIGFMNDTGIEDGVIELGYVIDPEYHNQGYMTEALKGAIDDLFKRGYREVVAGAFVENPASLRVMEKAGMTRLEKVDEIEYRGAVHRCEYCSVKNDAV